MLSWCDLTSYPIRSINELERLDRLERKYRRKKNTTNNRSIDGVIMIVAKCSIQNNKTM